MDVEKEIKILFGEIEALRKVVHGLVPSHEQIQVPVDVSKHKQSVDSTLIAYQNKMNSLKGDVAGQLEGLKKQFIELTKTVASIQQFKEYKNGQVPVWDSKQLMFVPTTLPLINPQDLKGFLASDGKRIHGTTLDIRDIIKVKERSGAAGAVYIEDGVLKGSDYFIEKEWSFRVPGVNEYSVGGKYVSLLVVHTKLLPMNSEGEPLSFINVHVDGKHFHVKPNAIGILMCEMNLGRVNTIRVEPDPEAFHHGYVDVAFRTLDTHLNVE